MRKLRGRIGNAAAGLHVRTRVRCLTGIPDLIRSRRTHKSFGPEPVPPEVVDELLELARWAPNHHRTNPWRFRVLGPETLERLKEAAGPAEAPKLERAPTLVVASALLTGDLEQDEEDICATASAIYAVLLAAHARGLAGYWRTPTGASHQGRSSCGRPARRRAVPRPDPPRDATQRPTAAGAGAARRLPRLPPLGQVAWQRDRGPRPAAGTRDQVPPLQEDLHGRTDGRPDRTPPGLQMPPLPPLRAGRPSQALALPRESFAVAIAAYAEYAASACGNVRGRSPAATPS